MANEKRLIPCGEKCTLDELLPGMIFAFGDDCIAVKSEYRCNNGLIEAFIIDSGEQFWCGAKTAKEQNELMVQPLEIADVDAEEVVHGRWLYYSTTMQECSNCHRHTSRHKFKYCPHCGAIMEDRYNDG